MNAGVLVPQRQCRELSKGIDRILVAVFRLISPSLQRDIARDDALSALIAVVGNVI